MLDILKLKSTQLTLTAAFTGLTGVAVGYIYASKRLESVYAKQAQEDIDAMKEHYKLLRKVEDPLPEVADALEAEEYKEVVKEERYSPVEMEAIADVNANENPIMPPVFEKSNVFKQSELNVDFDYEEELAKRSPDEPYVITQDEFMNNETSYEQITITYYDGDDALSDDKDQIINDIPNTVGDANLLRFGHGSNDRNIVYVRNDKMELEFEITLSQGKFAEEVLGFIEHSDKPRVMKFRGDHE